MSETFDLSNIFQNAGSAQLQRQFVGKWFLDNARTKSDPNGVWVEPIGELHSREDQAVWWDWIQREQAEIIDDATWKSLELLSPNGAVSAYSTGDGSTTFRAPSVGNDGGFIRAKGKAVTDPVILNIGFQDQIQNITGSGVSISHPLPRTGAFGDTGGGNIDTLSSTGDNYPLRGFDFDASRVARTGTETHPKGMWGKYFIYTGKDIPIYTDIKQPRVVNRNLFINSDESVNQDNVTNWASVTARTGPGTGYGFDGTIKIDDNTKTQIIEEGEFVPDTIHTMSWYVGNDRFSKQVTSPSSGHWESSDLHMPINAIRYKLEKGPLLTDWVPDGNRISLANCMRLYEKGTSRIAGTSSAALGETIYLKVPKRIPVTGLNINAGNFYNTQNIESKVYLESLNTSNQFFAFGNPLSAGFMFGTFDWVVDTRL